MSIVLIAQELFRKVSPVLLIFISRFPINIIDNLYVSLVLYDLKQKNTWGENTGGQVTNFLQASSSLRLQEGYGLLNYLLTKSVI